MKWLLDTNVLSENVRPHPNRAVLDWLRRYSHEQFAISVVTIAELQVGIRTTRNSDRRAELTRWIEDEINPIFANRILALTTDILIDWLELGRNLAAIGFTRAPADLLIAATARIHGLIIVTRDFRDFAGTGAVVYDPWTGKTHHMDAH